MRELSQKFSKLSNLDLLVEYRDRVKYDHYDPCGSLKPKFDAHELMVEILARMEIGVR